VCPTATGWRSCRRSGNIYPLFAGTVKFKLPAVCLPPNASTPLSPPQQTEITDNQKRDAPAANRSGTTQKTRFGSFQYAKREYFSHSIVFNIHRTGSPPVLFYALISSVVDTSFIE